LGTWKIVAGILIAIAISFMAHVLDLKGIEWIYSNVSPVALIALIVIFQPELRRAFAQLGSTPFASRKMRKQEDRMMEFLGSKVEKVVFGASLNQEIRKNPTANFDLGIELFFAGRKHFISAERVQIVDLLLSVYENSVHKTNELKRANELLLKTKKELELDIVKRKVTEKELNYIRRKTVNGILS